MTPMSEEAGATGPRRPDTWLDPDFGVRISLLAWEPLCRIDDQFIERPRSLRMIWSYMGHVGVMAVVRKVISRRNEKVRNKKVVALGVGVVLEAGHDAGFNVGSMVVCLALNHPETPVRNMISIDYRCVRTESWLLEKGRGASGDQTKFDGLPAAMAPWKGWSPFSGMQLDGEHVETALRAAAPRFSRLVKSVASPRNGFENKLKGVERIEASPSGSRGKTAVIFGLGNYAKTQIIPVVRKEFDLVCIHEIDPDQFIKHIGSHVTLDSSPLPRKCEHYDAWFLAGYHHTHASLAVEALKRGSYAVIEKPLATTREQLNMLYALENTSEISRFFACFQKRYSKMHEWAREDLNCGDGKPVNMYASVFEIPLPRAHWYNWPVSGSRLISNGCHWLDYFMYINDYVKVANTKVIPMGAGDILAVVGLENGARLVLSLTDTGSARLGVREIIELRCEGTTVRIIDAKRYEAENTNRLLRLRSVNPVDAYHRMYTTICSRIRSGESGDSVISLRSTELMLRLEQQLPDVGASRQVMAIVGRLRRRHAS